MDVLKEKDVLAPAPADEDPDDWPCHILEDVVIYSQDGKSLVNLLEAELHGPFLVQGKLEVETQYKSQCKFLCYESWPPADEEIQFYAILEAKSSKSPRIYSP